MEVTRPAIKEMALELAKECIAVEEARRRLEVISLSLINLSSPGFQ